MGDPAMLDMDEGEDIGFLGNRIFEVNKLEGKIADLQARLREINTIHDGVLAKKTAEMEKLEEQNKELKASRDKERKHMTDQVSSLVEQMRTLQLDRDQIFQELCERDSDNETMREYLADAGDEATNKYIALLTQARTAERRWLICLACLGFIFDHISKGDLSTSGMSLTTGALLQKIKQYVRLGLSSAGPLPIWADKQTYVERFAEMLGPSTELMKDATVERTDCTVTDKHGRVEKYNYHPTAKL